MHQSLRRLILFQGVSNGFIVIGHQAYISANISYQRSFGNNEEKRAHNRLALGYPVNLQAMISNAEVISCERQTLSVEAQSGEVLLGKFGIDPFRPVVLPISNACPLQVRRIEGVQRDSAAR